MLPKLDRFSLLTRATGNLPGSQVGGKFALPAEFDRSRYAASFYRQGQEANSMRAPQILMGSNPLMTAPGWEIWKYPGVPQTKVKKGSGEKQIKGKSKDEDADGGIKSLAGKPHKVMGTGADETYVLMFRPIEVQQQVDLWYAEHSRTMMVQEVQGDTIDADVAEAGGMITAKQMTNDLHDRDVQAEAEFEEFMGKTAIVHGSSIPHEGNPIRTKVKVVRR